MKSQKIPTTDHSEGADLQSRQTEAVTSARQAKRQMRWKHINLPGKTTEHLDLENGSTVETMRDQ